MREKERERVRDRESERERAHKSVCLSLEREHLCFTVICTGGEASVGFRSKGETRPGHPG